MARDAGSALDKAKKLARMVNVAVAELEPALGPLRPTELPAGVRALVTREKQLSAASKFRKHLIGAIGSERLQESCRCAIDSRLVAGALSDEVESKLSPESAHRLERVAVDAVTALRAAAETADTDAELQARADSFLRRTSPLGSSRHQQQLRHAAEDAPIPQEVAHTHASTLQHVMRLLDVESVSTVGSALSALLQRFEAQTNALGSLKRELGLPATASLAATVNEVSRLKRARPETPPLGEEEPSQSVVDTTLPSVGGTEVSIAWQ
jgi:hypothetical protein